MIRLRITYPSGTIDVGLGSKIDPTSQFASGQEILGNDNVEPRSTVYVVVERRSDDPAHGNPVKRVRMRAADATFDLATDVAVTVYDGANISANGSVAGRFGAKRFDLTTATAVAVEAA